MLLNAKMGDVPAAMPFSRIWCAFEIHVSLSDHESRAELLLDIAATDKGKAQVITDGLTKVEAQREKVASPAGRAIKVAREQHFPVNILREGLSKNMHSIRKNLSIGMQSD